MRTAARLLMLGAALGCSPEAARVRDGGAGADPGNKRLVESPPVDPRTRDTTLWPGLAPTPVERLERGETLPPASARVSGAPASEERRTFEKGTEGDARRQQSAPPRRPPR